MGQSAHLLFSLESASGPITVGVLSMSQIRSCISLFRAALRRTSVILFVICCYSLTKEIRAQRAEEGNPQAILNAFVRDIESSQVQSAEILYIPTYILRNINVTPERLQRMYKYKIVIPDFSHSHPAERLRLALRQTTAQPTKSTADLRWELKAVLRDGRTIALYVDGFGRLGQVQTFPVRLKGKLYEWLRGFTECMD